MVGATTQKTQTCNEEETEMSVCTGRKMTATTQTLDTKRPEGRGVGVR